MYGDVCWFLLIQISVKTGCVKKFCGIFKGHFNSKDITLRTVNVQKYKILFFTSKIDLSTNICLNGILKKIMKRMKVYVHLFVYR